MEHNITHVVENPEEYGFTWIEKQWSRGSGSDKRACRDKHGTIAKSPCMKITDIELFTEHWPERVVQDVQAAINVWNAAPAKKALESGDATSTDYTYAQVRIIEILCGINHRGGATQRVLNVPHDMDEQTMKILASANPGIKIVRAAKEAE